MEGASLAAGLLNLNEGDSVASSDIRLVMARADLHVLTPNDGLARWVEVRSAELHRRHLVVVRAEFAPAAVDVMALLGESAPRRTAVPCPSGWIGYEFEPVRNGSIDGRLAVLSPRGNEMVALDGGLPISAQSRMYLTAGPPDVLLNLATDRQGPTVDGIPISGVDASGRLRLAGHGLAEGTHKVTVAGAHLTVRLMDEHALGPTTCALGAR